MCGKMRRKGKIRFHMALLICILISVMITGCGKKKIQVIIKDGQTETKLDVKERETVEKVLEQAEIAVNSKDIIIKPGGIHSKITKPDTKIIPMRFWPNIPTASIWENPSTTTYVTNTALLTNFLPEL